VRTVFRRVVVLVAKLVRRSRWLEVPSSQSFIPSLEPLWSAVCPGPPVRGSEPTQMLMGAYVVVPKPERAHFGCKIIAAGHGDQIKMPFERAEQPFNATIHPRAVRRGVLQPHPQQPHCAAQDFGREASFIVGPYRSRQSIFSESSDEFTQNRQTALVRNLAQDQCGASTVVEQAEDQALLSAEVRFTSQI